MKPLDDHPKPVNLQASKIFWKAPWWAQVSEVDEAEVIKAGIRLEDLVTLGNPPPPRPGGPHNQLPDLRGTKVRHKKRNLVALVLGYAYATRMHGGRRKEHERWWNGTGWTEAEVRRVDWRPGHRWYAFFGGQVNIIEAKNWKMAGNYERITPPEPPFDKQADRG